jgi:hypothetical protein
VLIPLVRAPGDAPMAAPHGPAICSPIRAPPAASSREPVHVPRCDPNRPLVASIIPAAPTAADLATSCTPPQTALSEAFHASWFKNVPFRLSSVFEKPPSAEDAGRAVLDQVQSRMARIPARACNPDSRGAQLTGLQWCHRLIV